MSLHGHRTILRGSYEVVFNRHQVDRADGYYRTRRTTAS